MRVRMRTTLAGVDVVYHAGEIYEFEVQTARRLIDAGIAEAVETEKPAERPTRRRGGTVVETAFEEPAEERG